MPIARFIHSLAPSDVPLLNRAPAGAHFAVLASKDNCFEICGIFGSLAAAIDSSDLQPEGAPHVLVDLSQAIPDALFDVANVGTPTRPKWHIWPTTPDAVLDLALQLDRRAAADAALTS